MQKNKSQAGNVHIIVVILIIFIFIGAIGFVLWNNFLKEKPTKNVTTTDSSQTTNSEDEEAIERDPYERWKKHTSLALSGLSFMYPSDWEFIPANEELVNNMGGKSITHNLYSKKPQVKSVNGNPVTTNQFMCVTITEYSGNWQYSKETYSNELSSEEFSIAGVPVLLNTYSDATLDRDNRPMGNIMRLMASKPSSRGQAYIDTKNGYVAQIVAQYNCLQGGEGIEDLNANFESQPDTIVAKLIMKSIKF